MVASVKMKKAQNLALEGSLFREHLSSILSRIVGHAEGVKLDYIQAPKGHSQRKLYIIISSNKGLCGSFNFNLAKFCIDKINFDEADFIIIGKKSADFVIKMKGNIIADFSEQTPFIDNVSAVFTLISEKFLSAEYEQVFIVYNKFISTLKHYPTMDKILPVYREYVSEDQEDEAREKSDAQNRSYLIEPSPRQVLQSLISDHIRDQIRSAIADSEAAEHSARMIAMKNATDSASELIYGLTLLRNKLRQTSITNELLDITSASEIKA